MEQTRCRQALGVNQVIQLRKIVFLGEERNEERGVRDGGFPDRKARMLFAIDQDDADALFAKDRGEQRTGQSIAKNRHIEVVFGFLQYHRLLRS